MGFIRGFVGFICGFVGFLLRPVRVSGFQKKDRILLYQLQLWVCGFFLSAWVLPKEVIRLT